MEEIIATGSKGRRTVLVVEDERLMLQLLQRILSSSGYDVLTAADGEEAINVYRRHKLGIDMVLLDLGLPKISGVEVFAMMKEANPAVCVVVASGYLERETKNKMHEAGVIQFVDKPYMIDKVLETLNVCTRQC
jgi:two-component system, cell cycle sensor histidine kinase and response regulator CckA